MTAAKEMSVNDAMVAVLQELDIFSHQKTNIKKMAQKTSLHVCT